MILKQANAIVKKLVDLLAGDEVIRTLLKNSSATPQDMINDKLIVNYPVILDDNSVANFISIIYDNSIIANNNVFISSYKISCGVALDKWLTDDGEIRSLLIASRIEEILDGIRIEDSTGEFNLTTVNSVFWNPLVTGQSLIFQITEMDDISNETII